MSPWRFLNQVIRFERVSFSFFFFFFVVQVSFSNFKGECERDNGGVAFDIDTKVEGAKMQKGRKVSGFGFGDGDGSVNQKRV